MSELRASVETRYATVLDRTHARILERAVFNQCIRRARELDVTPSWTSPAFATLYAETARGLFPYVHAEDAAWTKDPVKTARTLVTASASDLEPSRWVELTPVQREGFEACRRCQSTNTSYHQVQTRSSDEPMTVFLHCKDCGKRWKM